MTFETIFVLVALGIATLCIATSVLYAFSWICARKLKRASVSLTTNGDEIAFLFDDETLVNATTSAKRILTSPTTANTGSDWTRLLSVLTPRFPSLAMDISELASRGDVEIQSVDGSAILRCNWRNGLARLTLDAFEAQRENTGMDSHSIAAMEQEIDTLRAAAEHVPFPIWRTQEDGSLTWANAAYLTLSDSMEPEKSVPTWPPKAPFDVDDLSRITPKSFDRLKLIQSNQASSDSAAPWYDVYRADIGGEALFSAASAEKAVRAETALCEFHQTLAKTFAHLTIGLAIFDRNRKLVLFNPALTDLTSLPIDFLSTRPSLPTFLDRLRDRRMVPEPKDYKSWREEMTALEDAAAVGAYEEVWSLSGGLTYRVSGRPHPDGAIAFIFEDISAEMSLTRRFRAEIETGQSALDALGAAVAVFSNDGSLLMSNAKYASLWGLDNAAALHETRVNDAIDLWHSKCAPSQIWSEAAAFVMRTDAREEWSGSARLWDGRRLTCRFVPLRNGRTFVEFAPEENTRLNHPLARRLPRQNTAEM